MDQANAMILARQYALLVSENFQPVRVFLFGSFARGNYHRDSDIDSALIFKDYNNILDMQMDLMRLRRKIDSRIEPHPFRENEFDLSNPIACEMIKHGKEINLFDSENKKHQRN